MYIKFRYDSHVFRSIKAECASRHVGGDVVSVLRIAIHQVQMTFIHHPQIENIMKRAMEDLHGLLEEGNDVTWSQSANGPHHTSLLRRERDGSIVSRQSIEPLTADINLGPHLGPAAHILRFWGILVMIHGRHRRGIGTRD
jgi:hypothetical protein